MKIRYPVDKAEILPVLETDRLYAAYAIGDLNSELFPMCTWAIAEDASGVRALSMVFKGLQTPSVFMMGQKDGLQVLLCDALRLEYCHLTMRAESLPVVAKAYRLVGARRMWRMTTDEETFRPGKVETVRLAANDIAALNTLYAWGGADYFAGYQLEQGIYYGVAADGKLVAAAGTHVVAPEYGIAAVGNVYTHPDYRNRGFATACTGAVTAALLALGCRQVVLNVWQENAPAVRAYSKLGYRVHCPFLESPGERKTTLEMIVSKLSVRRT